VSGTAERLCGKAGAGNANEGSGGERRGALVSSGAAGRSRLIGECGNIGRDGRSALIDSSLLGWVWLWDADAHANDRKELPVNSGWGGNSGDEAAHLGEYASRDIWALIEVEENAAEEICQTNLAKVY
jgi:hypothetical protein